MMVLADANLLLYAANPLAPAHGAALGALTRFVGDLVIAPQALYEFWVVATRSRQANGFGESARDANDMLTSFIEQFRFLADPADLFDRWRAVVTHNGVSGKRAHDARLVAFMHGHGITRLATFNANDFQSFEGLEIIVPS